jgi:hypothetical protein
MYAGALLRGPADGRGRPTADVLPERYLEWDVSCRYPESSPALLLLRQFLQALIDVYRATCRLNTSPGQINGSAVLSHCRERGARLSDAVAAIVSSTRRPRFVNGVPGMPRTNFSTGFEILTTAFNRARGRRTARLMLALAIDLSESSTTDHNTRRRITWSRLRRLQRSWAFSAAREDLQLAYEPIAKKKKKHKPNRFVRCLLFVFTQPA